LIHGIATIQVKPQSRDRVLREIAAVTSEVMREDGCFEYSATIDVDSGLARLVPVRQDVVTIAERWRDLAALQTHSAAQHMQTFRQRISDAVVSSSLGLAGLALEHPQARTRYGGQTRELCLAARPPATS
jgi:quinol monooxygenase YgiN